MALPVTNISHLIIRDLLLLNIIQLLIFGEVNIRIASVTIIYLGTIDPYINRDESQ